MDNAGATLCYNRKEAIEPMSKIIKIVIVAVVAAGVGLFLYKFGLPKLVTTKPKVIGILRYIQQTEKVERGFYRGMEELGYSEGTNVRYIATPYGESPDKMQALAETLIDQQVDLIVAITSVAAGGAKKATESSGRTDIPVVFTHSNQPDKQGHIQSFQSSGNNLTGVAINYEDVTEKKLEFLKKMNPSIKKVGVLDAVHTDAAGQFILGALRAEAPKFGMEVVSYAVKNNVGPAATAEIAAIASRIKPGDIDAFFHLAGPISNPLSNVQLIIDMAKRLMIPAVYLVETQVELGGLMSYAHDQAAMGQQTAVMINKILNGQRPTDIPVEFPKKNSLVINLKTARESGITFPDSILFIAETKIDK